MSGINVNESSTSASAFPDPIDATLISDMLEYGGEAPPTAFASPTCAKCKGNVFTILMNDLEGVAARICAGCDDEHGIGDSDDFVDEVDSVESAICTCGGEQFRIAAGVSLYRESQDVRWFFLACRCEKCELSGVYADWKSESGDLKALLARV